MGGACGGAATHQPGERGSSQRACSVHALKAELTRSACCCQVMRLHALVVRPAPAHPLAVPRSPAGGHLAAQLLRERALALLAAPLGGDQLAAEYLLLTALGTVSSSCISSSAGQQSRQQHAVQMLTSECQRSVLWCACQLAAA